MSHRTRLATIPLDNGIDLVVSLTANGAADVRLWTQTGDLKFPSKDGVTVPHYAVRAVIDALKQIKRRAVAWGAAPEISLATKFFSWGMLTAWSRSGRRSHISEFGSGARKRVNWPSRNTSAVKTTPARGTILTCANTPALGC